MAMVVIILALQTGVLTNNSTMAQAMIIMGIALKTIVSYSFKVASARSNSDATNAGASVW